MLDPNLRASPHTKEHTSDDEDHHAHTHRQANHQCQLVEPWGWRGLVMLHGLGVKGNSWTLSSTSSSVRCQIQLDDVQGQGIAWLALEPFPAHAKGNIPVAVARPFRSERGVSFGGIGISQFDRDSRIQWVKVGIPGNIVSCIHDDIRSVER